MYFRVNDTSFFYTVWGIILLLAIIERVRRRPFGSKFISFFLFVVAFITACRVSVGTDWESYVSFYYIGVDLEFRALEPLFTLIRYVCYSFGFTHAVFFLIISLISLVIYYKLTKMLGIRYFMTFFFVYMSMIFFNHQFSLIRHGLVVSIIWLGFVYLINGKVNKAYITVTLAVGVHFVALFFIPFIYLLNKQYSHKTVFIILPFSLLCIYAQLSQKIINSFSFLYTLDRVSGYLTNSTYATEKGLSVGTIFIIVFFVVFYLYMHDKYESDARFRVLLNSLFWCVVLTCVLNAFSAVISRVCNVFYVAMIFLLPLISENLKRRNLQTTFYFLLLAYMSLVFPKTFSFNEETGDSTLLPFVFDSEQLINDKKNSWY